MKQEWIAVAAVVVAVGAVIIYKEAYRSAPSSSGATVTRSPRVVLIADPREAESTCGCGEIIRMVRSARAKGVAVLEAAPGSRDSREYRATVNPTVLFLDEAGRIVTRYEGEAPDTIAEIQKRLEEAPRK